MYKKQTIDNKNGNILENVYTGNKDVPSLLKDCFIPLRVGRVGRDGRD
jgi:hypothetical protein